jgi:competence protein ComEA
MMDDTHDNDDHDQQPTSHESPQHHRFLKWCLCAALLLLTGQWIWISYQRPEPLAWQHGTSFASFFQIDINNSTWVEWIQLKGIGETMAHRIVAEREINGPFASIEDLLFM